MPRCTLCKKVLPPYPLTQKTSDGKAHTCIFCDRGQKEIRFRKGDKWESLKKDSVVKEYNIYLKKIKDRVITPEEIVKGKDYEK